MKATITHRVDECTFQCGYEMRRCTACGKSARTVPVLLSLECGAELMGFVCKTCVHAASVEQHWPRKREHFHRLLDLVASEDVTCIDRPGGHIGLMAGSKAREEIWPEIAEWPGERSQT